VSHHAALTQLNLNEAQRRHLTVAIEQLDETLLEVIGGDVRTSGSALRPRVSDVPAEIAERMARHATALRTRLAPEAAALELSVTPESTRRRLRARLAAAEILLHDARPRAMRSYGAVDPTVAEVLDPWLDELIGEVRALLWLLGTEGTPRDALA
jgi:hypothetical protein